VAVAAMLVGALIGALLEKQSLFLPLAVTAAMVGATLAGLRSASSMNRALDPAGRRHQARLGGRDLRRSRPKV
jgi:hypothetical protein